MPTPEYVVIRLGSDVPADWIAAELDGQWFDRAHVPVPEADQNSALSVLVGGTPVGVQGMRTGRTERRASDGAVAEIWELRPIYA